MKKLLIIYLIFSFSAKSQSIEGSWKRTSAILEYNNGKTFDSQKSIMSSLPCTADIQYVFEKSDKHFMILPKGCEAIPNDEATWQIVGDKFSISQKVGKENLSTSYELSFSGNILTMTHVYLATENIPDVKKIVIQYQRL
jgi:hypothetical protein